ncbi:YhbY family RNA-binding protein [Candidatus Vallotia tarda]|uniref:YhbY family RNA-binding protein n=1 Tax=Candidatus Vallotiella hemipterorum TaxID=1177213 RepID=A0A916NLE4_9BURK|nr:YhbY family RNA-binding protein [Candidatus Vallotia tarda]CAG7598887.1 YhbY family RNA-binding protein [Candidatus Vallotia tarda]
MPALTLSSTKRTALRSQVHALKPVVLIGANGLTDSVINEIDVQLKAQQLIIIRVFSGDRIALCDMICNRLSAAPIQNIGKLLAIWRPQFANSTLSPLRRNTLRTNASSRVVKVVKPSSTIQRPKLQWVKVLGNERLTSNGNVKKAKKRQISSKRQYQLTK